MQVRFILLTVLVTFALWAQPAAALSIVGTWEGHYYCAQGRTLVTIEIWEIRSQYYAGQFSFRPPPGRRGWSGSYEFDVDFRGDDVLLRPTKWISRPPGFMMVSAIVRFQDGNNLYGQINARSCGEIAVRRTSDPPDSEDEVITRDDSRPNAPSVAPPPIASRDHWQSYTSSSGWTSFAYPPGWSVTPTDRTPSRYLENYGLQPRGQDFQGRPGQVGVRVFDPMYVIEEAGVRTNTPHDQLFRRFVSTLPGATPSFESKPGSKYLVAREVSQGFETVYLGVPGANGYLNVIGLAAAPRATAEAEAVLYGVADSLKVPGPSPILSPEEGAIARWHQAMSTGDRHGLEDATCASARVNLQLLGLVMGRSYDQLISFGRGFKFSDVRYQTVASRSGRAGVRMSGVVIGPGGQILPVGKSKFNFGGSNVLVVLLEEGRWRVCGPLRGGNQ